MVIKQCNINPILKDFVSRIMLIHYQLDKSNVRPVNPFPPQPEHCLYFYPYDKVICHNFSNGLTSTLPQSIFVGPQLSLVNLSMGYNTAVVYVGFLPGGLHRLLRVPMDELCNQSFDSSLFLKGETNEISEQINSEPNYLTILQVVEDFLIKKIGGLKQVLPIDRVLAQMSSTSKLMSVDTIAREACISTRQLERQFKERIGMNPKVYTKLVRFSRAWNLHESNPRLSWNRIAHHCDYADQMHLVRDFKQFAGVVPTHLQYDLEKTPLRLQNELGSIRSSDS